MYPDAFSMHIPLETPNPYSCYIIDGMFIINVAPLTVHKTFADYASFLFSRWIVRPHQQFKAGEIHVIFDHPNRNGTSPKDIERIRRDGTVSQEVVSTCSITPDSPLPTNWRNFLSVRYQKRQLVNFLSSYFLSIASETFIDNQCIFVTAGGFDDDKKDKAMCVISGEIVELILASGSHEEADTRVWLHATVTTAEKVII